MRTGGVRSRISRTLVGAGVCIAALTVATPSFATIGEPVADGSGSIFRDSEWVTGETKYNYLYGDPYVGAVAHTPAQTPSAGEVFYIHAEAALIWIGVTHDVMGMTLALPDGVSVAVSGATPMRCFVTGTRSGGVPTRATGECVANPSPASGVQIPLGAITLFTGGPSVGGEIAHVFVPVVSNRAVSGENVFVNVNVGDPAPLPRDVVGTAPLTVLPGSGPTELVEPSAPKVKWKGKGKALIAWDAVPGATSYRARLKVGKKWTKWSTLSSNGVKLTKLKKGKRYVLQVQAVGDAGQGPVATWRFKAKK